MFEAKLLGVNVSVVHLIPAVVILSVITTYLVVRTTHLKAVAVSGISILSTQLLAGALLLMIRSETAQPVHDAQSWIAHQLAWFNITMFWLLCPVFSGPVCALLVLWLKRPR